MSCSSLSGWCIKDKHMKSSLRTDHELWSSFLQGNDAAFGELTLRYQRSLVSRLRRLTGEVELAQDLVQDTFLSIFQKRETLSHEPIRHFGGWLHTCAHQQWMAHTTKQRHRRHLMETRVLPQVSTHLPADALSQLEQNHLTTCIGAVKHPLRKEILLLLAEGHTAEEMAEFFGKKTAWVHQNTYLARQELLAVLDRDG